MNKNVIKMMSLTTGIVLLTSNTAFAQGNIKKEEAVYINLNSKGAVVDTTVSDWLHSDAGFTDFKDTTVLSNILNVKNDDAPKISGTEVLWNSKNTDIFYQGKTDKPLPLNFNITYKLDGVEIDPKDIASKSGNVQISLKIINNDKHDVTIQGEKKTLYTPFLTAAVVSLSMDKFKNITTNAGEMISDGNNNVITFATVLGLKESLNINDETIKVPEELIINAEVKNFSLPSIMITSTSSLPNIDKIDAASSIDELQDGIKDLVSASSKILDGIGTLSDGSLDLNNGIISISGGITDLYGGSSKLKNGANSLNKGLNGALAGSNNLNNGLLGLQAGFGKLVEGGSSLKTGTTLLKNGYAAQMSSYENLATSLEGILSTMDSSNPYKDSLSKVLAGIKGTNAASSNITTGIATIEGGLGNLNTGLNTSKAGIDTLARGSASLNEGVNSLYKGSLTLSNGVNDLNSGLLKAKDGSESLKTGSNKIYSGTVDLKTNYEKFHNDGILSLSNKLDVKIDDLNLLLEKKDELVKLSKDYNVFSGDSPNVEGNTKFIFKTEEIKGSKEVVVEDKLELPVETNAKKKTGVFSWIMGIFTK